MNARSERKLDHITNALSLQVSEKNGFDDFHFIHNSLPKTNVADVNTEVVMGELSLSSPIFINAMTGGGGKKTMEMNQKLSIMANECNMAIAVGSQKAAIRDDKEAYTYRVVRKELPKGIVFANLGAECGVDDALAAVSMLEANALQLHLNVIQELVMPEGDRDFRGILNNIEAIVKALEVPVIVKEVGFGMSMETIKKLEDIGVSFIDIAGNGGTNFSAIENKRREVSIPFFDTWGIPTALSLTEAVTSKREETHIIASGGIRDALDVVKSLSIGASCVGMAGPFLKLIHENSIDEAIHKTKQLQENVAYIMTALGADDVLKLRHCPIVVLKDSKDYLEQRGISLSSFAQRQR